MGFLPLKRIKILKNPSQNPFKNISPLMISINELNIYNSFLNIVSDKMMFNFNVLGS